MPRQSWVQIDGKLVPKSEAPTRRRGRSMLVIDDAYQATPTLSPVDHTPIGSRAQLREHNRRNNVTDVGNDAAFAPGFKRKPYEPAGVVEDVQAAVMKTGGY